MTVRAFDTIFVAKANRQLAHRKSGNLLDQRLEALEDALGGSFTTRTNHKLNGEYAAKIDVASIANDVVRSFLEFVIDRAEITPKSNLTGAEWEKARKARWPSHDRHLVAAVISEKKPGIFVTEVAHVATAAGMQKQLGIQIIGVV